MSENFSSALVDDFRLGDHDDADAARVALAGLPDGTTTPYQRYVKPAFDRVVAAVLLILFAPLLALVALSIRLHLGPGVIYRQTRIGYQGRPFTMLKFRTMEADRRRTPVGERRPDRRTGVDRRTAQRSFAGPDRRSWTSEESPVDRRRSAGRRLTHKTSNDPRHTGLGRLLRATSLDELPQLVNVVRGDLSLVGPRPELPEVVATYAPWQHARHAIKPGLTGLWQITDRAGNTPMIDHVDTDLRYLERVSPKVDAQILLLTVPTLLGLGRAGRGT